MSSAMLATTRRQLMHLVLLPKNLSCMEARTDFMRPCRFPGAVVRKRSFSNHAELAAAADALASANLQTQQTASTSLGAAESGATSVHSTAAVAAAPYIPPFPRLGIQTAKYSVNLSKLAQEGKLDPVIGRDDEIDRAIQILSRRTKNNPCFIGEAGVGKTAIAEELARRISVGEVPEWFRNKVILTLDLPSMLAGTKFRGEFEERFKGVLKEIEQCGDRVILFIDELHIIAGAGGSEGAIDASNILKPSLSRGLIKCMGATTTDEYRTYIEKDPALARRFQSVFVSEPTIEVTKKILEGLREKFESYHNIIISDDAIDAAVNFAGKYLTERRFPDKAIDLLDEAGSRLRIDLDHVPSTTTSTTSTPSSQSSSSSSSNYSPPLAAHVETWTTFKNRLKNIFMYKANVGALRAEQDLCRLSGNMERVAFIENVEMKEKLNDLAAAEASFSASVDECNKVFGETPVFKDRGREPHVLRNRDIAVIITKQTGIPIGSLLESEKKSLLNMESELNRRVIGQDEAIRAISKCIRLSRAGLRHHDRPLGVFLMIGGTGVGKTEVAKSLSEFLFHDTNATHMLRIDMSEYMERFSVSRLIGAPPGYVGYDEGGALTESVRRRPYQVVLLDEFEKAHRDVSNLLLQVFDEGRLSDSQGRLIDFRNTVIIMTSNLSCKELVGIEDPIVKAATARKIVGDHFAPEFVNRVDDVVVFNPLSIEATHAICKIQLTRVEKMLRERGVQIDVTDNCIDWISRNGFDPSMGARPVKRLIQARVLDPLATVLLEDKIQSGDYLKVLAVKEGDEVPTLASVTNEGAEVVYSEKVEEATTLQFHVFRGKAQELEQRK